MSGLCGVCNRPKWAVVVRVTEPALVEYATVQCADDQEQAEEAAAVDIAKRWSVTEVVPTIEVRSVRLIE